MQSPSMVLLDTVARAACGPSSALFTMGAAALATAGMPRIAAAHPPAACCFPTSPATDQTAATDPTLPDLLAAGAASIHSTAAPLLRRHAAAGSTGVRRPLLAHAAAGLWEATSNTAAASNSINSSINAAAACPSHALEARRHCIATRPRFSVQTPPRAAAEVAAAAILAAQTQNKDVYLLMALTRQAASHAAAGHLSPAQIRDLGVAFAHLGFFDVGFQAAAAEAFIRQVSSFEPCEVADTLYALAGLGQHRDVEMIECAVDYITAHAPRFDAACLSKALWSLERCGCEEEVLLDLVGDVARQLGEEHGSVTFAEVLRAESQWLGDAGDAAGDAVLAELAAAYTAREVASLEAGPLAGLMAALTSVGYNDAALSAAAARRAAQLLAAGGSESLQRLLPLFPTLNCSPKHLTAASS